MKAKTNFINIANDIGASDKAIELAEDTILAALGLYVLMIGYCDRQRTDGAIPTKAMKRVIAQGLEVDHILEELVRVGFIEQNPNGWMIIGYLEWQRSRSEIEAAAEQRRQAGLASGRARREKNEMNDKNDKNDKSAFSTPLNDSLNDSLTIEDVD